MSHKSYRVNTKINNGDTVLKVNLKQGIDTLKVLSLEVNSEDAYQLHTSNYGVIVGRVLANDAFGVPNVKVSVFIPISDEDQGSYVISNEYPYKTTQSKNNDGIKYNLLCDEAFAGLDGKHKSVGTFPNKRLVLDNDGEIEVFDKYWKYTTVTNESGDYMIFGVPTGTCQVHFDCDLSDIGIISQKPYDFINKGYSASLFKSATEFNDDMADTAVQVMSQDKTVFVYPFWGDNEANEIGITRSDLNLDYKFEPSCIFMGSSITDSSGTYIGTYGMPNGNNGRFKSLVTSSGDIEIIRQTPDGYVEEMKENVTGIIDGDGVWCYAIPMNLDRVGTDEEGNIMPISNPNKGIPTRARVRFRISLTDAMSQSSNEYTAKVLVPCNPKIGKNTDGSPKLEMPFEEYGSLYEFGSKTPDSCFRDLYWGKVYSIKQYYPRIQQGSKPTQQFRRSGVNYADYPVQYASPFSAISSIDAIAGFNAFPYNTMYAGAENMNNKETRNWFTYHLVDNASNSDYASKGLHFCFENDWINGCLYFPRVKIVKSKNGTYQYFGANQTVKDMYITGRHNLKYENGKYTIRDNVSDKWSRWYRFWTLADIDDVSCFSYIMLSNGLLKRMTTMFGESVFYYKCGDNSDKEENSSSSQFIRLYATDIILLGNLSDVYDSIPRLFETLPSTTTIFPPLVIPKTLNESGMNMNCYQVQLDKMWSKDTDDVDIFGNFTKGVKSGGKKCEDQDWSQRYQYDNSREASALFDACFDSSPHWFDENGNSYAYRYNIGRYAQERSSLFFGYRVWKCQDFLCYFRKSFPNLSRICELDVNNDSAFESNPMDLVVPINGVIDRYDIANYENRSNFASLNYDITRTIVNPVTGYRRYIPTPMNLVDFEGRLDSYFDMYDTKMRDEDADMSYIKFRYADNGSGPRMYHPKTMPNQGSDYANQEPLILTENSFYFYFGLRAGNSAIDAFKNKYYASGIQTSNISDLIGMKPNGDVICGNDGNISKEYSIMLDDIISLPVTYYIYSNGDLIKKGVSDTSGFNASLPLGLNRVQIIDSKNRTIEKSQYVFGEPLDIDYTLDADERTCTFISINGKGIQKIVPSNENKTLRVDTSDSKYYLDFDVQFERVGITNTIRFQKGIDSVRVTSYNANSTCDIHNTLLSFTSANAKIKTINNVPLEVLVPWNTQVGGKYVWNSKCTQISDTSLYGYTDNGKYNAQDRLKHISSMVSSVYDGSNMSINGASYEYTNTIISPNYSTFITNSYNAKDMWNSAVDFNDDSSRQYLTLGNLNTYEDLPSIVGKNYPVDVHDFSQLKIKKGGHYENNNTFTVKNGKVSEFVGKIYLGLRSTNGKDLPSNPLAPSYDLSVLASIQSDKISNYFEIETVDKRLDYEAVLLTPLVLASGYDKFTSLSNKALNGGKIKAEIYGGLKFDHDENNTITCYQTKDSYNISGQPTSDARMYTQTVYEDGKQYFGSNLPKNVKMTVNDIWNVNKNDDIVFENNDTLLSGSTSITLDMIACSGDFSDWHIKAGKSVSPTFSYKKGIELVHGQISEDNYDILYEQGPNASTYYATLKGSSLSFRLVGDDMFAGNTYTDIDIDAIKKDASNENGDRNSYPSWAQKYVNDYGDLKTKELSVLRCDGTGLNVVKEYLLNRTTLDSGKEAYPTLNYDKDKSFFAYYIDEDGKTELLTDTELNSVYQFSVNPSDDRFGEYDYLIIPTRKVYRENNSTLLKQAVVYNTGCAFYASRLSINKVGGTIIVKLYSPLIDGNGALNTNADKLVGNDGKLHTVGNVNNFYCENGDVTYDENTLSFTITPQQIQSILPFYFSIENGLKYKVNLKL